VVEVVTWDPDDPASVRAASEVAEMNYLFQEPLILDDSALAELLGTIRKTSSDDGVHVCLGQPVDEAAAHLTGRGG